MIVILEGNKEIDNEQLFNCTKRLLQVQRTHS